MSTILLKQKDYEELSQSIFDLNLKVMEKDKEIERLSNIINELEKRLEVAIEDNKKEYNLNSQMAVFVLRDTLELIEELKGVDKE